LSKLWWQTNILKISGQCEIQKKGYRAMPEFYAHLGKRVFDIALALPATVVFAPILAFTALLVRFKFGRPVLFQQARPGLMGKPFRIYKFRTMTDDRDAQGNLLSDDKRLTRFGRFLRATSIDELPELVNVLKGDMSLVGPRPLLMQYLDRYSTEQARRHEVKPGVTGWAQVNGRNDISWEDKFKMDVWYVDHYSFRLDVKIIGMTALRVVRREGISQRGMATASEFKPQKSPVDAN